MYRTPHNEERYKKDLHSQSKCPFCTPNKEEILQETTSFRVLINIYGYDLWDRRRVKKHLMIVPKAHIINITKINKNTAVEYLKLLKKYSQLGFDIFTRSTFSKTKTQPHFHTHLIKTNQKLFNTICFEAEPYNLSFK